LEAPNAITLPAIAACERAGHEKMSGPPLPAARPSLRAVALPVEHGGWGMLVEPLAIGLILAPTVAGLGLAVAALGAFLLRHPLKLALLDVRRGLRAPRTALAWKASAAYGAVAVGGLALVLARAPAATFVPLALAAPLALAQLRYDARLEGRHLLPELLGSVSLGASAAALMLAGHWAWAPAFVVWALLAAKALTSVLYIRARLRLDRDQPAARWPGLLSHVVALALAVLLALAGWGPWLAVAAFAILLARAGHGLSPWHARVRAQTVGFTELGYGVMTAVLVAAGYAAGL